jgi:exopolysaccharide production protein ExoZ
MAENGVAIALQQPPSSLASPEIVIFEFLFGVALAYMPRWGAAIWCLPIGAAALITTTFLGVS